MSPTFVSQMSSFYLPRADETYEKFNPLDRGSISVIRICIYTTTIRVGMTYLNSLNRLS